MAQKWPVGKKEVNIIYYFQASVSIRSRYSLYIDDCVSTTKPSYPIRRVMQRFTQPPYDHRSVVETCQRNRMIAIFM